MINIVLKQQNFVKMFLLLFLVGWVDKELKWKNTEKYRSPEIMEFVFCNPGIIRLQKNAYTPGFTKHGIKILLCHHIMLQLVRKQDTKMKIERSLDSEPDLKVGIFYNWKMFTNQHLLNVELNDLK